VKKPGARNLTGGGETSEKDYPRRKLLITGKESPEGRIALGNHRIDKTSQQRDS